MLFNTQTIFKIIIIVIGCLGLNTLGNELFASMKGTVSVDQLSIRSLPDDTISSYKTLLKGTVVDILSIDNEWVKVFEEGRIGYVKQSDIEIETFQPVAGVIKGDDLNVRPLPNLKKPPISRLHKGTRVEILGHVTNWYKIKINDTIGYISDNFVYISESAKERIKKGFPSQHIAQEKPVAQTEWKNPPVITQLNEIKNLENKKAFIHDSLENHKASIQAYQAREQNLMEELDLVDRKINTYRKTLNDIQDQIVQIDEQLKQAQDVGRKLVKAISYTEKYVSKRLVALYKLKRSGASHIIYTANSLGDLLSTSKHLEYLVHYDLQMQKKLISDKGKLDNVFQQLREQRQQKADLIEEIQQTMHQMASQKSQRKFILANIRTKKSYALSAMQSLEQSALNLNNTIDELRQKSFSKTDITGTSFSVFKGKLNMPVNGHIVAFFGPYRNQQFDIVNFRNGVDISAEKGEPIKAVCAGRLLFADWFKGYGNMIIIDHGDSYYTIYAHADEIFKRKGDYVEAGEVVGTLGETGSVSGPCLYFEIRHHGKPMDPINWLRKG